LLVFVVQNPQNQQDTPVINVNINIMVWAGLEASSPIGLAIHHTNNPIKEIPQSTLNIQNDDLKEMKKSMAQIAIIPALVILPYLP